MTAETIDEPGILDREFAAENIADQDKNEVSSSQEFYE